MKIALRVVLAILVYLGAAFFVRWIIVQPLGLQWSMRGTVSSVAALGIAWYAFRQSRTVPSGLASFVLFGTVVVGGVGYAAGFLVPLLLLQSSPQNFLLSLFITGPIGTVAGAIGGAVWWLFRRLNAPTAPPSPS